MLDLSTLGWAFGAGILAAAPVGPVNAVAIRRGLIHRWTHTMFVGLGSVLVETCYVALALWGGYWVLGKIAEEDLHRWVGLPAAGLIICLGLVILRKAIVNPQRILALVRLERMRQKRATLFRDVLIGAGFTAINPATLLYWVGAGAAWLDKAQLAPGSVGIWYGLAAAVAGLVCWFGFITALVALRPQKVGPEFFRTVNALCGAALTVTGMVLLVLGLLRYVL